MNTQKEIVVFSSDSEIVDLFKDYNGCSMAVIDMTTLPKTNKKSRADKTILFEDTFKGTVYCTSTRYVSIGNSYETSVNNRLTKENNENAGSFEALELPWGQWYEGSRIIIEHKGKFYLRYSYLNANGHKTEKIYHYENGEEIDGTELDNLKRNFLPLPKTDSGRQDTQEAVKVNSMKIEGIIRVKFDGKIYVREGFLSCEEREQIREATRTWRNTMNENESDTGAREAV